MTSNVEAPPTDGRRARGDRSRRAVLDHAVQVASVEGLGGLTFGSLATAAPVNKSGIAGLFGSKEGLQLAVVDHARTTFVEEVITPARAAEAGVARLWALVGAWTAYSRSRVFTGGCFFRAAEVELDGREAGPVRDAVVAVQAQWDGYLSHQVERAVDAGQLVPDADPEQVAFEIDALLGAANDRSLLLGDDGVYLRAHRAIRAALVARGADPAVLS
ncbi:TetR/AcrR family transcriptional regulator [Isoptericola sp. S6320L]|uniref:TetR/AcrR family transcriptional regulator n=1 Tax=Isoptericola sp. S6320L TaxID=2926411 RepID=UPI001FF4A3BE|nr:TetR/AcrR family transcriptional regulator [Isoptericola sp. S6320L]MCK0115621.1 TetR/AcrR family transcriptional regulator [Isoptericola sp. S6320L]